MKILHCVESYHPALGGMQEVVKRLSELLAAHGHDVTVATTSNAERNSLELNGVNIREFNVTGNLVNGLTGDVETYRRFLLNSDFDVITFFAAQQWATDAALDILGKINAVKVSVPTGYSGFYWPAYEAYFNKMKNWIHGYDMNVYLSNDYRDIRFARENGVNKICLIPNGASAEEFYAGNEINVRRELGVADDVFLLLHVGSYSGWKGHETAMEIFLRSKINNGAFLMIGNGHENFRLSIRRNPGLFFLWWWNRFLGRKKIVFNYFNRKFTVAAYKQADIFLFPSNIECSPIVLFEAAAGALPFLSTDAGNAVEIAGWTHGGMILPTTKDKEGFSHADINGSVQMLNKLFDDAAGREKMGSEAHAIWRRKYTWESIALAYQEMYTALLKEKKQGPKESSGEKR